VELGHLGRGEGGKEHGRAARVGPNMAQPRGGSLFIVYVRCSYLFKCMHMMR
jgi:hypothetical protein